MNPGRVLKRFVGLLLFVGSSVSLAQGASESLEREARAAFKAGRFKEAAIKFQDAADSATESARRGKMQLQAGYALFNDKNPKAASEAVRRALDADPELEIVAEFYAPDFVRLVQDVKREAHPARPPAPVDVSELKRVATEKLKDGHADEVVYDLTHVPPEKLDAEAWQILATAYDAAGKPAQAEAARRAASGGPVPAAAPELAAGADVAPLLAEGRAALAKGDLSTAQAIAARVLEAQPGSSEGQRLLGDAAAARGDRVASEAAWQKALELDPHNDAAADALVGAYLDEKDLDSALALLQANPALSAKAAPKLASAARALARDKDPRAPRAFAAALASRPNDAALLTEYGSILLSSGDGEGAIDALRRAAAAAPASPITHTNLAAALRRKGDLAEAEKEYREALAIDAESPQALDGLGTLLLSQGKAAEAVEPLRRASAREAAPLALLVRAQRESGDPAGALASAQAARDVEDPALWREAGAAAYAAGRYGDAASYFERALARTPDDAAAKESLEKARQAERFMGRMEKQAPLQGLVTTAK